MLRYRPHCRAPPFVAVDSKDIGVRFVAVRGGGDEWCTLRDNSVPGLPIEGISPAVPFESRTPRRVQHLEEVDRPVQVALLARGAVQGGKAHGKMSVCDGQ